MLSITCLSWGASPVLRTWSARRGYLSIVPGLPRALLYAGLQTTGQVLPHALCRGGPPCYCGIRCAHAVVYSVSLRDAICTRVESARTPQGVSAGLLILELANLLCVKAAFATLRKTLRRFALTRKFHIPSVLVVAGVTAHRKPPEVRICRLRNQSAVGTRPPSTSTPHCPACMARR
jgi:hypothetical protein